MNQLVARFEVRRLAKAIEAMTATELAVLMPDATKAESWEPEFESSLHSAQLWRLTDTLEFHWRDRNDFFIGADLSIYYSRQMLSERHWRSPHFFLAKNVEKRHRWSWVVWEEDGRVPDLAIDLLSDESAELVKTAKLDFYASQLRIPEIFWFHPFTTEFAGFELCGTSYRNIPPDPDGRCWSQALNLWLGVQNRELRYFTPAGELVPTPTELASGAAHTRKMTAKLRELGIDPTQL